MNTCKPIGVIFWVVALSSSAAAEARYNVSELSYPPGAVRIEANGISDRGLVVGTAYFPGGMTIPMIWEDGRPRLIDGGNGSSFGYANGINNLGHAAVTSWDANHNRRLAVVRHDGRHELRPFSGIAAGGVLALNDRDHAVGFSTDATGANHAVLWRSHAVISLGVKGEEGTAALDINDADRIIGVRVGEGSHRGFRWHHGKLSWFEPLDPGAQWAAAAAMNNAGLAVGASSVDGNRRRAVLWLGTQPLDLGTLVGHDSSSAADINDAGVIVGRSFNSEEGVAVFCQGENIFALNDLIPPASGWHLYHAQGINNFGQIIGRGAYAGREAVYLLTPVPEPRLSVLLVASGMTHAWTTISVATRVMSFRG